MKLYSIAQKLIILLLLISNFTANGQLVNDISSTEYIIQINKGNPNIAKIEANIVLNDSTIRMAAWGHPWLEQGWTTFVKKLIVTTDAGNSLSASIVNKGGWGKWKVLAPNGTKIQLSYEVHFNHKDYDWNPAGGIDSRPEVTDDALFLVSKALFILQG